MFRVCDRPTHIDAREVLSNISWVGSDSTLIHRHKKYRNSSIFDHQWSYGLSNDFGYVRTANPQSYSSYLNFWICRYEITFIRINYNLLIKIHMCSKFTD